MKELGSQRWIFGGLLLFGIVAPFLFPNFTTQLTVWWVMVLFALTWDISGGQMGYNSLGNILFFGVGMYASTIVQIGLYYDVAAYTTSVGAVKVDFSTVQYFTGLATGIVSGGIVAVLFAIVLGGVVFGLRGPYFAIGTLGMGLAAAELVASWDYVGGGGGVALPVYPGHPDERSLVFYFLAFIFAVLIIFVLKRIYSGFFGIAANAIRDDEEKAEGMGIHTLRYKIVGWSIGAFFVVGQQSGRVRAMLDEWGEHDSLAIVFVKQGVLGTGGGGFATIGGRNAKTTIHEWGHAFAGLGDEYATKTHERGGVSRRIRKSGDVVRKGDLLAQVGGLFGEDPEGLVSPLDGVIIGHATLPIVNQGDALFHIAEVEALDHAREHADSIVEALAVSDPPFPAAPLLDEDEVP